MKKALQLCLAVTVFLCILCSAAFAAEPVYVALGDSIADGYALSGYTAPGCAPADSFPVLLEEAFGFDLQPLAVSGLDTDGLLYLLTQNEAYRAAISQAELITLTIGSNDILIPAAQNTSLGAAFSGDVQQTPDVSAMLQLFLTVDAEFHSDGMKALFESRVAQFRQNWDSIIALLRSYNPNAVIIATSFYNPYALLEMEGNGFELHIGSAAQEYLDQMNEYLRISPYESEYFVADISEVSTNVCIAADASSDFNLDPHPDTSGHAFIAETVSSVLKHAVSIKRFNKLLDYESLAYSDIGAQELGSWPIREMTELGLICGRPDGSFGIDDNLTVAEALTIAARLHRTYIGDSVEFDQSFGEHWYETYILYCVKEGIISWNTFSDPNASILTGDFSLILYRSIESAAFAKQLIFSRSPLFRLNYLHENHQAVNDLAWACIPVGSYPDSPLSRGASLYYPLRILDLDSPHDLP